MAFWRSSCPSAKKVNPSRSRSRSASAEERKKGNGTAEMNTLRTTVLLAALTALILVAGEALGGRQGMQMALLVAAAMNFFSYWFSDKIVLAMHHAKPVSAQEAPELHALVQRSEE